MVFVQMNRLSKNNQRIRNRTFLKSLKDNIHLKVRHSYFEGRNEEGGGGGGGVFLFNF